jgi:hypothetical protein
MISTRTSNNVSLDVSTASVKGNFHNTPHPKARDTVRRAVETIGKRLLYALGRLEAPWALSLAQVLHK